MRQASKSNQHQQIGEIAPEELEQILRRIDENLARSQLLSEPDATYGESGDIGAPPMLPDVGELSWRLEELRYMRAPLFVIKGRDWRNQIKRLMNLPIRILSFKQISFNRQILELIDQMLAPIQQLPRQAEYQAQVGRALARQQQQVASLQVIVESLVDQIGRQNTIIEQQQHALRDLREAVAGLGDPRPSHHQQGADR